MCGLYSLPLDLIRVILQYVSLRDIARLFLATNNHKQYEILTEVLQEMEYSIRYLYYFPNSLYCWVREKGIRFTTIIVQATIPLNLIRYLELYGHWVTFLQIDAIYKIGDTIMLQDDIPSIIQYTPNVQSLNICIQDTITNDESKHIIQLFQGLPLKSIFLVIYSNVTDYCELDLAFLLQTFPLLEKLNSPANIDVSGLSTAKTYPLITCIDNIPFQYSHLFPNIENIIFKQESKVVSFPPSENHKYKKLNYTIDSKQGLQILQQLLNMMPNLTHLQLTAGDSIKVEAVTGVLIEYSNIVSLSLQLNASVTTFSLEAILFLLPCCPRLSKLEIRDCQPASILLLCQCALHHCKQLVSLYLYVDRMTTKHRFSVRLATTLITKLLIHNCCQDHQHIRSLYIDPIIDVNFHPTCNTLLSPLLSGRIRSVKDIRFMFLPDGIVIQMIYYACPGLQSVTYQDGTRKNSYRLFQYSHNHLQKITGGFDVSNLSDTEIEKFPSQASFPSLRSLSITDNIDGDSWNRMLSKCEFTIHRLTVRDSDSLEAIMDSLLHHRNFRELHCVFICMRLDYNRLEELTAATGRRIQFHNKYWWE